jgi:hypothetical protein
MQLCTGNRQTHTANACLRLQAVRYLLYATNYSRAINSIHTQQTANLNESYCSIVERVESKRAAVRRHSGNNTLQSVLPQDSRCLVPSIFPSLRPKKFTRRVRALWESQSKSRNIRHTPHHQRPSRQRTKHKAERNNVLLKKKRRPPVTVSACSRERTSHPLLLRTVGSPNQVRNVKSDTPCLDETLHTTGNTGAYDSYDWLSERFNCDPFWQAFPLTGASYNLLKVRTSVP